MTAAEFSHRLRLQEAVETQDGGGGIAMDWRDIAEPEVFARIEVLEQPEVSLGRALRHPGPCRITLRFRADVTANMRLIDDSYAYHIMSFRDPDGRGALLAITALRSPL